MIGKLSGRVDYIATDHVMIDVRGVGYVVFCSERTLMALPEAGKPVALFTDLLVREDLLQLFGFTSLVEKEWYRLLMSVQGIGARASLAILGALGADGISRAIALGDWATLRTAKGVGPKTAQRVVNELKDKAPAVMAMVAPVIAPVVHDQAMGGNVDATAAAAADPIAMVTAPVADLSVYAAPSTSQADALSALANLGYSPTDAATAVVTIIGQTPDMTAGELIKQALRLLAPRI